MLFVVWCKTKHLLSSLPELAAVKQQGDHYVRTDLSEWTSGSKYPTKSGRIHNYPSPNTLNKTTVSYCYDPYSNNHYYSFVRNSVNAWGQAGTARAAEVELAHSLRTDTHTKCAAPLHQARLWTPQKYVERPPPQQVVPTEESIVTIWNQVDNLKLSQVKAAADAKPTKTETI